MPVGILQQLIDRRIPGSISWMFGGSFQAMLSFTHHRASGRGEAAGEIGAWLIAQVPALVASPNELLLVQRLHDAEFNGSIEWLPGAGFWARLDQQTFECDTWLDVQGQLRNEANRVLRRCVDIPDTPEPG